jgi:endonuclease III
MEKVMNVDKVYRILGEQFHTYRMPVVDFIEAQTKDPFKVLITTILSARTKDSTTTQVVKELFKYVNTPEDLAVIPPEKLEEIIYQTAFHHNKTIHLKQLPAALREKFNNVIPDEIDDLVQLPGVGRKTANLVRVIAFHKPAVCVDVHVHRICNRLGYVKTKTPFETEMALRAKLPEKYWMNFNSYLVAFGQNLCTPLNPHCNICPIFDECKRVGVKTKYL